MGTNNSFNQLTSIIILTHNQLLYTKQCIESIRTYTEPGTYEIIVVDNASSDGTQAWLAKQEDIKAILNETNQGFPKGCNQGIEISKGGYYLLLNNDTVVTMNWLSNLLTALNSSTNVGAAGPITNSCSYYQSIETNYETVEDMQQFAAGNNISDQSRWEKRLKLVGFCMIIKREVVDKIGMLDECFEMGNFEDDDYSMRMLMAGYTLLLCKDTFIHHYGSVTFASVPQKYTDLMKTNSDRFLKKWGFRSEYSTFIRHEIINLIELKSASAPIRVLEVGCACGGTLLKIKDMYPNAELYGIELNQASGQIANRFADVRTDNVETTLSYPANFFDYIIFADVLEHLYDPWKVVENAKNYLKEDGKMLVSLPNVSHFSVIRDMLEGNWTYQDAGLMDRTHVRFFTRKEMIKMFERAGFNNIDIGSVTLEGSSADQYIIDQLQQLTSNKHLSQEMRTYQYLFRVSAQPAVEHLILDKLLRMDNEQADPETINQLIDLLIQNEDIFDVVNQHIKGHFKYPQKVYNMLVNALYQRNHYNYLIPFLQSSLEINHQDADTLYNLGFIFYRIDEYEKALQYLNQIQHQDEDLIALIQEIQHKTEQSYQEIPDSML
ncbi:glycosyltransferase [Paenibacillus beijingensis]|uniref:glycosyltransferase n=1 Tax=Paenibacillus beijingensis TaxID=1126833 RepID=UPI001EE73424|nr:glycosyltransferase [Paenibacillus beijingensis]